MKMTVTWLESRKEPKNRRQGRYDVTVAGRKGLMVRVFPSGAASFRLRYTRGDDRYVMVLGEFGEKDGLTLAEAFHLHDQALQELERDLDPLEERQKRLAAAERGRAERAGAGTVADLVEQFVHRKLRAERWDEADGWVRDERMKTKARKRPDAAAALLGSTDGAAPIRKRRGKQKPVPNFVSELGKLNAHDLTKRKIIAFLDSIVDRGSPVTANRIYALLKQLLDWAAAKDLIPASPMAGVERPGGEERPRERVLTADEIRAFWTKLETADMADPTKLALKLLLATGQRRGEITLARWKHFDLDAKLWTIPVELLKTSHSRRSSPEPHIVPLSDLAIDLMNQLKMLSASAPYVLPAHASKKRTGRYSEGVLSRAVRQNADHFGIPHFTPHDLRRTAASFMTKLKVPRLHVEKVLNHSTGDIAEVYDRHDYLDEKRTALGTWGAYLSDIVGGKSTDLLGSKAATA
jgi:integrase